MRRRGNEGILGIRRFCPETGGDFGFCTEVGGDFGFCTEAGGDFGFCTETGGDFGFCTEAGGDFSWYLLLTTTMANTYYYLATENGIVKCLSPAIHSW
ncbi:hypothetical protein M8J75_010451 [Diaphorina citri]|nr:hypothetical protein M8J75_010451 [Diaphorina citri]